MRKYDSKNKRNIGIIVVICILVAVIFSFFLIKVINLSKVKYELESSSELFDIDKNNILLNESGTIKKKWNQKYYLTYMDEQYQIGNHVIAFNNNEISLTLYGEFYEINKNSEVNITKEETKLNNLAISRFYKLEDRKYLIVDSNIKSEDEALVTTNYLIVELDRLGNAILYNNTLNVKTFKETKIVTSTYTFDIANELLIYENETVDLKKIIGTTNEYKKPEEENKDNEDNNGLNSDNNQTGNNANVDNNQNNNNGNNNSGNTGEGNNTNNDNKVENGDDLVTDEGGTDISDSEIINQTATTSILRITPSYNTIDVDYVIFDKANEYFNVFVEISSEKGVNIVYLSKNTTNISLTNLLPGTEYTLTFKYTHYEDEITKEETIDTYTVKTLLPNITINGTRIASKYISYEISSGTSLIESAVLRIYVDGVKQSNELIINNKNLTGNFSTSGITFGEESLIELSLEDIYVSGQKINKEVIWSYKKTVEKDPTPVVPDTPVTPETDEDSGTSEEGEGSDEE